MQWFWHTKISSTQIRVLELELDFPPSHKFEHERSTVVTVATQWDEADALKAIELAGKGIYQK